jgi:hypothetical protein
MPRKQVHPEELEPSRRGNIAGREHHEPDPDVQRIARDAPERDDGDDEDSIESRRDEHEDGGLDQVSYPGGPSGAGRSPDREAEAHELDNADIIEEIDLDDLEDDDVTPMEEPGPRAA